MDKPALPDHLQHIRVVLSRTSHPANIGAAARAMKTMGLTRLVLVAPKLMATPMTPEPPVFDPAAPQHFMLPEESFVLASGARDVLEQARVCATLDEALADTVLSCALTSRKRELTAPMHTPRQLAPALLQTARTGQDVALVFGNETFGLSIEEVQSCNRLLTINGNPDYFSLNLAQAVQVVAYEIFSHTDVPMDHLYPHIQRATRAQTAGMVAHLETAMAAAGFFQRRNQARLMRRLAALFDRADLSTEEVDILRGFCSTVLRRLAQTGGDQN